jgi:hypothetical protein
VIDVAFINGPLDKMRGQLPDTPKQVFCRRKGDHHAVQYDRIDDPDTGEFLGAYSLHYDPLRG